MVRSATAAKELNNDLLLFVIRKVIVRLVCRQVPSSSARPPTLMNIGTNPTVGNPSTTVEGYMLGVAGDVYGQQLCFRLAMVACRRHSFHTAKITK